MRRHAGDVRDACREIARVLDFDCEPDEVGGMSLRVGSACDIADTEGIDLGGKLIEDMGRWCSLIYTIYARLSAEKHMQAAVRMGDSTGLTFEELAKGWVQPARVTRKRGR